MKKKILIFSAGPASREVFQLIESINKFREAWEVIGYVDDDPKKVGKNIDNVKVYSSINKPKQSEIYAICGISNIPLRKKIFEEEIIKNKFQLTNLIHPLVEIPTSFKIGFGNIIFCKPGTKVIELRSSNAGPVIENLAKKNDLNYHSIIVEAQQIHKFTYPNQQGSLQIPITSLSKVLENY